MMLARFLSLARTFATALAAAAILSPVTALGAGAPLQTGGFENYTLGSLVPVYPDQQPHLGQQGWVGTGVGPIPSNLTANVENAVIQAGVAYSGTKSLQINRAPNIDNRWAVIFGTSPNPAVLNVTLPQNRPLSLPSHRFVLIDWDMRVPDAGGAGVTPTYEEFGPFFGVEAYDASTNTIGALGVLGVDASTGQVMYRRSDNGNFDDTGQLANFDQWYHYGLVLDFNLHTYTMYFNGNRITSRPFLDGPSFSHFTDADIAALSIGGSSQSKAMAGVAYIDNFRVLDGVPGDFDFDGDADAADLTAWRGAYGPGATGDADGDGDSDGNDLLIWQQNLGVDFTPAVPVGRPVPEPASWALLTFASLFGGRFRRRRLGAASF